MQQFWIWVIIGGLLIIWGLDTIGFSLRQWLQLVTGLVFTSFVEDTKQEKKRLEQPMDEVAASNPGCILLITGVILCGYGLVRWLS